METPVSVPRLYPGGGNFCTNRGSWVSGEDPSCSAGGMSGREAPSSSFNGSKDVGDKPCLPSSPQFLNFSGPTKGRTPKRKTRRLPGRENVKNSVKRRRRVSGIGSMALTEKHERFPYGTHPLRLAQRLRGLVLLREAFPRRQGAVRAASWGCCDGAGSGLQNQEAPWP